MPASTIARRSSALLVVLLLLTLGRAWAEDVADAVTLARAVALAFEQSPRVAALAAEAGAAEARVASAGVMPYDPELELEGAARFGGDGTTGDFEVGLSQTFELGGQRGHRVAAAEAELAAAREQARRAAQLLAADVELAFIEALAARERLTLAEAERALATTLGELAQKRLDAGAATQLDVNVAIADRGRVELRAATAAGDYAAAQAALAQAMALPPGELPAPAGALDVEAGAVEPLPTLLASAEAHRADLEAFAAQATAARARLAEARAGVWPSIGVRVFGGREEGTDTLVGAGVALPLPVFDGNQGEIGEALAALRRVEAESATARLDVLHGVVAAHVRYTAASAVAGRLRESVLGTLEDSLTLIERSFAAGQATWIEVLVTRTAVFDAQRALIEASASARRARVQLDVAAGRIATPDGEGSR